MNDNRKLCEPPVVIEIRKSYICKEDNCKFKCNTERGLAAHYNKIHNPNWLLCQQCGKKFANDSTLAKHHLSKHNTERVVYACPIYDCIVFRVSANDIHAHLKNKHGTIYNGEFKTYKVNTYKTRELLKQAILHDKVQTQQSVEVPIEEESKRTCCICYEFECNAAVIPCGHANFCFSCLEDYTNIKDKSCPTCRGPISNFIKLYF